MERERESERSKSDRERERERVRERESGGCGFVMAPDVFLVFCYHHSLVALFRRGSLRFVLK